MKNSKMSVGARLALAFAFMACLTLAAAGVGAWGIWKTGRAADELYEGGTVHLRKIGDVNYLATAAAWC